MSKEFRRLLSEGVRRFAEGGYAAESDLAEWMMRLSTALGREIPTDEESRSMLRRILQSVYDREVGGGLARKIPELSRYSIDRVAPQLRAELDRRIFAGADLIRLNKRAAVERTLQRFAGWVSSVPPAGAINLNVRSLVSDIGKSVAQLKFERRRVAIDQGHKLSAAVAHVVARGEGAIAAVWHDRGEHDHGYDARPEHLKRSGRLFLVRDSWAANEGLLRKPAGVKYTDEIEQPAELPYCFPGSTPIQWANGVEVGYRRWYSGQLTEIVTASGKTLRATPNHPVLTTKGFIACGLLQEGDDVIEIAQERIERVVPELANNHAEPTIAEIFRSLTEGGARSGIVGASQQFHGDGTESNVDIVRTARPLTLDFVTSRSQRGNHFAFAKTDLRGSTLRALSLLLIACRTTAYRFVGSLRPRLSPCGAALLNDEIGSGLNSTDISAGFADHLRDEPPAYAEYLGNGFQRLARFVAPTKIVGVKRLAWAGHVFNLQTADGYYAANGIIAHNCSCYYEYITTPQRLATEFLTGRGRAYVSGKPIEERRADSTLAQIRAGNYPKGRVRFAGLDISIETRAGEVRTGTGKSGLWSVVMPADYGYIRRTNGADDEQIDVYLGPNPAAQSVWVIQQGDPDSRAFDEQKVMLGFNSRDLALETYVHGFSDGRGRLRATDLFEISLGQLRTQLAQGRVLLRSV